jgi:hypothetical protein
MSPTASITQAARLLEQIQTDVLSLLRELEANLETHGWERGPQTPKMSYGVGLSYYQLYTRTDRTDVFIGVGILLDPPAPHETPLLFGFVLRWPGDASARDIYNVHWNSAWQNRMVSATASNGSPQTLREDLMIRGAKQMTGLVVELCTIDTAARVRERIAEPLTLAARSYVEA